MITLTLLTSNCDSFSSFKVEESADSQVEIRIEFDRIVSIQSQKQARDEIRSAIQEKLSSFEWICAGRVNLELLWYLHGPQRQETDKIGDIDNITKPIIDSLTGHQGLLIDDSQIGSIYSFWNSRNHLTQKDCLYIKLNFNNDECLRKENLIFVRYAEAVCLPLNVGFTDVREMIGALALISIRLRNRRAAKRLKRLGADLDRLLVVSSWDIHRTRLNGFSGSAIYTLSDFRAKCCKSGFSWSAMLGLLRKRR
jgi:Holliday junction resolvase RusA-like endonuclease